MEISILNTNDFTRNQYLRVGREWIKLYDPQENGVYIINTSGHTVKCLVSETEPKAPYAEKNAYPVGGSICQLRVNPNEYVYARACVDGDDDEVIVACNTTGTPVNADDVNDIRNQVNYIVSQVMRMNMTMTNYQLDQIRHINDFAIFKQNYYLDTMFFNRREAARGNMIMNVLNRIFKAEMWIKRHLIEFAKLKEDVKYFDSKSEIAKKVKSMSDDLSTVLSTTTSLVSRLDYLEPLIEEGWQDYDSLVKEHITPMKTELTGFHNDMRYLHNALVRFTSAHTIGDVNAIFDEIIRDASDESEDTVIAIRDLIVELMQATTTNAAQDMEISEKVDYGDNIHVTATLDMAAAMLNPPEPEPEPEPDGEGDTVLTPEEEAAISRYQVRKFSKKKKK